MKPKSNTNGNSSAGVYIHLPFCDRICPYCDFAVVELAQARVERYMRALHAELAQVDLPDGPVRTVYLGGGTPSALGGERIVQLLEAVLKKFNVERGSLECTLEANPSQSSKLDRSDVAEELGRYKQAGVTRLSVGVQSFDDAELHRLGRTHTGDEARDYIKAARAAGHASISLDLIAGVPGQTASSFAHSLDRAIACEPKHISVYGLTIEAGTPYATWYARAAAEFPDDDAVADLLEQADAKLTGDGYEHYEISNFARPGFASAHNRGYWQQRDCVALGMSACGYDRGVRYRNARSLDDYCEAVESGRSPRVEEERLSPAARLGEAAMLALRTAEGIRDEDFRSRFDIDVRTVFASAIKRCREAALLEQYDQGVRLTARGRLLANAACSEFLHPSFLPAPAGLGSITS